MVQKMIAFSIVHPLGSSSQGVLKALGLKNPHKPDQSNGILEFT